VLLVAALHGHWAASPSAPASSDVLPQLPESTAQPSRMPTPYLPHPTTPPYPTTLQARTSQTTLARAASHQAVTTRRHRSTATRWWASRTRRRRRRRGRGRRRLRRRLRSAASARRPLCYPLGAGSVAMRLLSGGTDDCHRLNSGWSGTRLVPSYRMVEAFDCNDRADEAAVPYLCIPQVPCITTGSAMRPHGSEGAD
jgi:hypothetical protein